MSSNAIAFVAGLGSGYLSSQKDKEKQKRDDEDRALRNEASQLQINAAKKQVTDQQALAQAGAPLAVTEGAGGMVKPETMDNRDVGLPENAALPDQGLQQGGFSVGGKSFASRGLADTELATQNAPAARSQRVIAAMSGIDPVKALDLEQTQTQRGREAVKFTQEQETYAKKLKDEGAIDALKALRTGDGAGMVAAFNKSGDFQIQGEPVLTTEPRDIPGVGSAPTYTATFNVKGKDGTIKPMTVNSHDLGMSLMPYEKWFDAQLKGAKEGRESRETDSKIGLQGAQTGYYESAAGAKDATATKSGYERMSEIDKSTLSSINKQRETINSAVTKAQAEGSYDPASAGSKALATKLASLSLQESQMHARYGEGGGSRPDPSGLRGKPTGPGYATEPQMKIAASGGMGADPKALAREISSTQAQMDGAKDPASKQMLSDHIAELRRQAGSYGVQVPNAAAAGLPASNKATPAPAPSPAPAPAPAPARPALDPAVLESRMQAENVEMGSGKRLQYSPEVKAYRDQKRAEKEAADIAASKEYRDRELKKSIAASKGLS